MQQLREIRLHLESEGVLLRVAKVCFGQRDASLYLVPYAARGRYFYGARTLSDQQAEDAFDFRGQLFASSNPKLSIHERGQVHIRADGHPKAGPVNAAALQATRGEHVATVRGTQSKV